MNPTKIRIEIQLTSDRINANADLVCVFGRRKLSFLLDLAKIQAYFSFHFIFFVKLLFSSLNFTWSLIFIPKLWKIRFFVSELWKKIVFIHELCLSTFFLKWRNSCVKKNFFKIQERKANFMQNLGTKTIFLPYFTILLWYFLTSL